MEQTLETPPTVQKNQEKSSLGKVQEKEETLQQKNSQQDTGIEPSRQQTKTKTVNNSEPQMVGMPSISIDVSKPQLSLNTGKQSKIMAKVDPNHREVEHMKVQNIKKKNTQRKKSFKPKRISISQKETISIDDQIKSLQASFLKNKLLKDIYTHFCKENHLSSIKSTLFDQKHKNIEQMTINKWMVFCKEFQIAQNLYSAKLQAKRINSGQTPIKLENSMVREQVRVKQMKQINLILTSIFQRVAVNSIKFLFPQFAVAIKLVFKQFKQTNDPSIPQDLSQFIKTFLCCSDQFACYNKLSNLKFTAGIAKIDYLKTNHKDQQKTNKITNFNKENQAGQVGLKKSMSSASMDLNSIIKDAKHNINQKGSQSIRYAQKKFPKLQLEKIANKKEEVVKKKEEKKGLFHYFDSTHDDILQQYFEAQRMERS